MLKPQDVVVALKLLSREKEDWSQGGLGQELVMSASEVNAGIKRLALAQLIEKHEDGRRWKVIRPALLEFLTHGIKYVFPAEKGAPSIGLPTANAAEPLKTHIPSSGILPIWPHKSGKVKGYTLVPLYPTVPQAAQNDEQLYQWLVIVDALRDLDNEEVEVAQLTLKDKLSGRVATAKTEKKEDIESIDDQQLDLLSI